MIFISEKQLIFRITVKGSPLIVAFSDVSNDAKSRFFTSNNDIAEAIRAHRFYRDGKIFETPEQRAGNRQGPTTQDPSPAVETITFKDITKAKAWLKKTYGSDAQTLRTPQEIADYCKAKKISITIGS